MGTLPYPNDALHNPHRCNHSWEHLAGQAYQQVPAPSRYPRQRLARPSWPWSNTNPKPSTRPSLAPLFPAPLFNSPLQEPLAPATLEGREPSSPSRWGTACHAAKVREPSSTTQKGNVKSPCRQPDAFNATSKNSRAHGTRGAVVPHCQLHTLENASEAVL